MSGGSGLRRTTWVDLAVPFVVIAITVYVLLQFSYYSIPPLKFGVPIPLGALAVVELVAARRVRAVVRHDPDAKPMAAIVIARCVALGKASSLVGAGVMGASVALVVRVLPDVGTVGAASHDAIVGGVVFGVAAVLVGAGLLLERAGIDPGRNDPRT